MTTATTVPLSRLEDQRLEFKSRDALKNPEKIAREVVAMLNADGGEVWIGLREKDGRAMEIEPISEAETKRERLLDYLIDTLEPAPTNEEVEIEAVELPGKRDPAGVLRTAVKPTPGRGPYAWLRKGGRHFERRVGARLRPMSREEVQKAFGSSSFDEADAKVEAQNRLSAMRQETLKEGQKGLWIGVSPFPPYSVDIQNPLIEEVAREAEASGNRKTGRSFVYSLYQPRISTDSISWGLPEGLADPDCMVRARLFNDGSARFFASSEDLGGEEELWPFALLEYPVSALRILSRLYAEFGTRTVLADIALIGVGGRGLKPGSPSSPLFFAQQPRIFEDGNDLLLSAPLTFRGEEIVNEPDRCAFRLIRTVYQGFGYREEAIPREFDRKTGRLILPE